MKPYGEKPVQTLHNSRRERIAGKRRARQEAKQKILYGLNEHQNTIRLDALDHDEEIAQMEYYDYHDPGRFESDELEWQDHDHDEPHDSHRDQYMDMRTPEERAFDKQLQDTYYYFDSEAN